MNCKEHKAYFISNNVQYLSYFIHNITCLLIMIEQPVLLLSVLQLVALFRDKKLGRG